MSLFLFLAFITASVDTNLTLTDAIQIAVESNYSLALSKDQFEIAQTNQEGGTGQYLPSATMSVTKRGEVSSSPSQTTFSGDINWVIFDGLQNFYGVRQLKKLAQSAELEVQSNVEALTEKVIVAYYSIVEQKQRLKVITELIAVSEERNKLATAKFEIGSGTKLEQLQAAADLNQDSSNYLEQTVTLTKAKINLNQLLARKVDTQFEVMDSIPLGTPLLLQNWPQLILEKNTALKVAKVNRNAALAKLNQAKGKWSPSLTAGISYSAAPSAVNSPTATQEGKTTYSANVSLPLFDKLITPTSVRVAKIETRQKETLIKQTEANIFAEYAQTKVEYQAGQAQIKLEDRNLQVARLQANAALEKYRAGSSSSVEFRDAQRILLDAELRLISAKQNVKRSETILMRLSGQLFTPHRSQTEIK